MPIDALPPISNPFATRYTRPDAHEYLFPPDANAAWLIARLRESAWWGQITGPHGSGKSTLVQTLLPHIEAAGRTVAFYAFHHEHSPPAATSPSPGPGAHSGVDQPGEPNAASRCFRAKSLAGLRRASMADWNPITQIVVDGYEQLRWLQRTVLKWQCRRRGAGLLVTAHDDLGLPPLWKTETSAELTQRVVAGLLGERGAGWVIEDQVERLFATHRGNLREVLFALYDLYEQRQQR
jgi:energy-coupling factor transporter ATP-binding protein EcfA2